MREEKLKILHIASDEKFINAANYIFEKAFPNCNLFIIPRSRFNRNLTYVTLSKNIEILIAGNSYNEKLALLIDKHDCVFLHGINEEKSELFLSSSSKEKFIGILWGAELYSEENFSRNMLIGDLTSAIELKESKISVKDFLKNVFRKLYYPKVNIRKGVINLAANRFDYLSVAFKEEFELFKEKKIISDSCIMIPFSYYPLEYIMKGDELARVNGNDILIGNSASLTNNHLEAFQILKEINPGNRRLIVPLSYGDMLYADYVQAKGFDLFNSSFIPLREFMSIGDYRSMLQCCGVSIMNHYRQQALGNILMMIWLGSKVYLNESNTIFSFLKRIGIIVFSIEKDLTKNNQSALHNLLEDEIDQNRKILKDVISENTIVKNLQEVVNRNFIKK